MKKTRTANYVARVGSLFTKTLKGDEDCNDAWHAVRRLRALGTRLVFDRCVLWSSSSSTKKRASAVRILGQLGPYPRLKKGERWKTGVRPFKSVTFPILEKVLANESDLQVLRSILHSFGHLSDDRAVPLLVPFDSHKDASLRYAVAVSLGQFHAVPAAVVSLIKLIDDPDREARDWAIFGVGVLGEADSPQLREIFMEHLGDPYLDARIEAACSLAKRKDKRVIQPLIEMFKKDGDLNGLIEAAMSILETEDRPEWDCQTYIDQLSKLLN